MKIRIEELKRLGKQAGFTHIAPLDCSTIKLLPEWARCVQETPAICMIKTGLPSGRRPAGM